MPRRSDGRGPGLERLREIRGPRMPDGAIGPLADALGESFKRREKGLGRVRAAWLEVVPPAIGGEAELVRLRAGVLEVRVRDASTRFGIDRFLRSGGLDRLIAASSAGLHRVDVRSASASLP